MRCAINLIPLKDEVCDKCLEAFWANITDKARAKGQRSG
jgi:hypothetical protein